MLQKNRIFKISPEVKQFQANSPYDKPASVDCSLIQLRSYNRSIFLKFKIGKICKQ